MTVLDAADGLSTSRGRQRSYDRFWHKADILLRSAMCAFGGKADMVISERNVCF
jgi:hypothetical protein